MLNPISVFLCTHLNLLWDLPMMGDTGTKSHSVCSQSGGSVCARHQLGWGHVHVDQELQFGRLRQLRLRWQQERPARLENTNQTSEVWLNLEHQVDQRLPCHRQVVTAGCGGAAATTWASARPFPSSSWTRWRRGRMPGLPWIFIITRRGGRWGGGGQVLRCCGKGIEPYATQLGGGSADFFFFLGCGCVGWGSPGPSNWLHSIKHLLNHFSPAQKYTECATQASHSRLL